VGYRVVLVPARDAPAWFWHVELQNTGTRTAGCDLILTQDVGLAHYAAARLNEYYVSQYVDHTPLHHARRGVAVASRQNQPMGGRHPWLVSGSLGRAVAYATDALQIHGMASRAGRPAPGMQSGLPAKRLQHEHSMAALQDETVVLEPGASCRRGFFGWFVPDKPAATRADDAACIDAALALPEACFPDHLPDTPLARPAASLFMTAPLLESLDLDDDGVAAFSGGPRKHEEHDGETLFSFFTPEDTHVVLKAKELSVLRPHGHLLHTGAALVPDESALTSTAWMGGIFHSMVTQGHVSINRFLSTCHGYLGLFRSHGQRVFADAGGGWMLLDMPSAFEMGPRSCRWIYQHAGGVIAIRSTAAAGPHRLTLEIKVTAGPPLRFLICHHIAINGDDGSAAIPATWKHDRGGIFIGAIPDSDVGRRFPHGGFRITPQAGTAIESIGGDEMLSPRRAMAAGWPSKGN
jgi:cellobiose phosphorylase